MAGYVLHSIDLDLDVHLADYQRAALQALGIQISKSTAENYLKASGFQMKTDGFSRSGDELAKLVWQWVHTTRTEGIFRLPRKNVCSIDFT